MNPKHFTISHDNTRIQYGLNMLLRFDEYLLAQNLSERSLTHKLAEHFQTLFYEWDVDCEYNRNLGRPKEIIIDAKNILEQMANTLEGNKYLVNLFKKSDNVHETKKQMQDLEKQLRDPKLEYSEELDIIWFVLTLANNKTVKKTIYPDIIIHHRGTSDNNIVLEVKKTVNDNRKARAYDLIKLMTLVSSYDFKYKRGYFIDLPVGDDFVRFRQFSSSTIFSKGVYKIAPEYKF